MKTIKVPGKNNKHKVLLYAISTCAWCKREKSFLRENNIEFEYVDIDLCSSEDREKARKDIIDRGGRLSYPAIIIDNKKIINGFHEDRIKEALED
ncbi:MAG: glutaredoxin family protein [Candidatus Bathyarchaeota archaeon]|nr:MAG: glutaredoxin family protein [Candidatus Bathyarchaeota archaeon]